MGLLNSFKKWIFGGSDDEEAERSFSRAADGQKEVARRTPKLPPVMSDALEARCGGLQGLGWFLGAFVCDEWGNVANDLLEPSKEGLCRRQGRKVGLQNLLYSCAYGVVDVRMQPPSKPAERSSQPTSTKSKHGKHKKRNRAR